jgi:perosamine synthetase
MAKTKAFADASGRGASQDYRISYPARMYPYTAEEIACVAGVMRSGKTLTQGEWQARFESEFREFTGARHAFAVSSGTAALRLAASLCRLGPGDEAILPGYTFCATAIPLAATGARLVWADIDPRCRTISPEDVARKITPRTKAIVAVHLLGIPCNMDALAGIASSHGLKLIEDCAQAPGAKYKGRRVGSIGDFGCFSFNGAKNLTTLGEGGMLTVRADADAALVPGLRHNGVRAYPSGRQRYWEPAMSDVELDLDGVWPLKYCMTEAQCALGSMLLKRLDTINATLRAQWSTLREKLGDCPYLSFQATPPEREHAAHAFVAGFRGERLGASRNHLMDLLTEQYRIRVIVQYRPLYRYPLFEKMGFGSADCPNLDAYWPTSFSYPWWCGISGEDLEYMAESTRQAVAQLESAAAGASRVGA